MKRFVLLLCLFLIAGCFGPAPEVPLEEPVVEPEQEPEPEEEEQPEVEEQPEEEDEADEEPEPEPEPEEVALVKSANLTMEYAKGSYVTATSASHGTSILGFSAWIKLWFWNNGTVPIHPVINIYVMRPDGTIEDIEDPIDHEDYLDQNPDTMYVFKPKAGFGSPHLILVGFDDSHPTKEDLEGYYIRLEVVDKGFDEVLDTAEETIIFEDK